MVKNFLIIAALLSAWSIAQKQISVPPQPASSSDRETQAVKIINGPVVEEITDSTAQIAWSTNVNAGTLIHYGTDPEKLEKSASMPWGGLTHRVVLKNLNPTTTYYFKAESAQGQDTGTRAMAPISSFRTVAKGEQPIRHMERR